MKIVVYGRPNVDTSKVCKCLAKRMCLNFTDLTSIVSGTDASSINDLEARFKNVVTYPESISNVPLLERIDDVFSVYIDTPMASWKPTFFVRVDTSVYDCIIYQVNCSVDDIVATILDAYDKHVHGKVQMYAHPSVCFPIEKFTKFDVCAYKYRSVDGKMKRSFGTVFFDNISVLTGALRQGSFVHDSDYIDIDCLDDNLFDVEILKPWLRQIKNFGGDVDLLKTQFETAERVSRLQTPNVEKEFLRAMR